MSCSPELTPGGGREGEREGYDVNYYSKEKRGNKRGYEIKRWS